MGGDAPGGDGGPILVVGYGNTLRRDDAVGPLAAEVVARWGIPGVVALATHQLLPELADPLSRARLAVFLDAEVAVPGVMPQARRLDPSPAGAATGHDSDPRRLLALARDVFGACPPAWLVSVPAADLSLGEGLSPPAANGMGIALRLTAELIGFGSVTGGPLSPRRQG